MTVYFCNNTEAPIDALLVLGVSVKTSDDTIGYFGTGFKFAIATLLRTGHKISINNQPFSVRETIIRGKTFNIVQFGDKDLGFTTDLGRDWQTWMAFRELHSNALDEGGNSFDFAPTENQYKTVISVEGPEINEAYKQKDTIFISSQPILHNNSVEIHKKNGTPYLYYRNVRVGTVDRPAHYTYNLKIETSLTEDRTLKYDFTYKSRLEYLILQSDNEEIIETIITANKGTYENKFDFSTPFNQPSKTFLKVVARNKNNILTNQTAVDIWKAWTKQDEQFDIITLSSHDQRLLDDALKLCKKLNCNITPSEIIFVETLGPDVLGLYKQGKIYIAQTVLFTGHRRLASTIYEEWLHKVHKFEDMSRTMQNYLFDQLFAVIDQE